MARPAPAPLRGPGVAHHDARRPPSPRGPTSAQRYRRERRTIATLFLTPAANCPDTAGAVPAGMRLVKVRNLAGAVSALHALAVGRNVPSC